MGKQAINNWLEKQEMEICEERKVKIEKLVCEIFLNRSVLKDDRLEIYYCQPDN